MKRIIVMAGLLLTPVLAFAAPLEMDTGSSSRINIVARGVKAAGPATAHGDLIEIPLEATEQSGKLDSSDADIAGASIIGGSHPRLVLKLHHSKHTCERLAAALSASEAGGALRLSLPRSAPAESSSAAAAPAEKPAAAPAHEATVEKQASAPKADKSEKSAPPMEKIAIAKPVIVDTKTQPKAEVPKAALKEIEKPLAKASTEAKAAEAKAEAKAEPLADAHAKTAPAIDIVTPDKLNLPQKPEPITTDSLLDDHKANNKSALWILGALVVGVPALWFAQKQRKGGGAGLKQQPLLKVLATQSLGGKSRLVMVDADGKRILLAVNDNNTRVVANLDQALAEASAPLPAATPSEREVDEADVLEDARAVARTYGDDLDIDIEEPPVIVPPRREQSVMARMPARSESSVMARIPVAPRAVEPAAKSNANSSIAGLLKLRADANTPAASNDDAHPTAGDEPGDDHPGPSEWGDALRRAVSRVKS